MIVTSSAFPSNMPGNGPSGHPSDAGMTLVTETLFPTTSTKLLAGGGVRGGQIYGASGSIGAYALDLPVTPDDYMATIPHAFGYAPESAVYDQLNRPQRISLGTPVTAL